MKLPDSALVLEVGSGNSPWWRADVLVDRYYTDPTGQRAGIEIFRDRRPLIVAAGERLPFRDKAFDYVFTRHVIEHAENIGAMLDELSRVAKAGEIECPNPALERVLNSEPHRWYIANHNGKLRIHPKTRESNLTGPFDRLYFHLMSDHFLIKHYWDLFIVKLEWQNRIEYEICTDLGAVLVEPIAEEKLEARIRRTRRRALALAVWDAISQDWRSGLRGILASSAPGRSAREMLKTLRRKGRMCSGRVRVRPDMLDRLLCCPSCRGDLQRDSVEQHTCRRCGTAFRRQQGVYVFL